MSAIRQKEIFVSYAREDVAVVEDVVRGLDAIGASAWVDRSLSAGQEWWDEILQRIRGCDVFLQVVSRAAIGSLACTRERTYARALGKPVLPVLVETFPVALLPPDIAGVQCVDYSGTNSQQAFALAGAVSRWPLAPELPSPLPPEPPVPLSYLVELSDRIHAPSLTLDDQLALVARLRAALADADERDAALELLRVLNDRPDLFRTAADELEALLGPPAPTPAPAPPEPRPAAAPPRSTLPQWSFWLGVASVFFYWALLTGPIAVVLGVRARRDPRLGGRTKAAWGIALGAISAVGWLIILIVVGATQS
jgi:hypothetical protein